MLIMTDHIDFVNSIPLSGPLHSSTTDIIENVSLQITVVQLNASNPFGVGTIGQIGD